MINLLGIGYDANGSHLRGPALAPLKVRAMQQCGSANEWCERGHFVGFGHQIQDLGDIAFESDDAALAYDKIYATVLENIQHKVPLISIGGDHSIAYPVIKAHAHTYGKIDILQIDAHGDLYENFEDNFYSHASPFARLHEDDCVHQHTQIGIRSLNDHQRQQIEKYNVRCIEMKHGQSFKHLTFDRPIYISLDVDGLDPAYAPGVSHHEPGGLTTREMIDFIHNLKVPIIGAEIVEINPLRDLHDMTAMLGYKLIKEIASKILYPHE